MYDFKIGIMVDSFRLNLYDGIRKSKETGAEGIQINAVNSAAAPENLTPAKRKELLDFIRSEALVVSALCGDLGGHGFSRAEDNPWKIEKSKRIMDLAKDLDCNIVTTHIGVIPEDPANPKWKILQEACEELGEYGDKIGASFAIETGPETAATLELFLNSLHSKGVQVNFDPANFVMVTGDDPVRAVRTLKGHIVHTHAKDGIMIRKDDPEKIYGILAKGGIECLQLTEYFCEKPLGYGSVDFDKYLDALDSIGYKGFLTIEREVGENPGKDIRTAADFLKTRIIRGRSII